MASKSWALGSKRLGWEPGPASQAWCGPGRSFPAGSRLRLLVCEMDMVILASVMRVKLDERVVRAQVPYTMCSGKARERGS